MQVTKINDILLSERRAEMNSAIVLVIGIIVGMTLSRLIFGEKAVGSLRVDTSDPDSGPYLFLELNRNSTDEIYRKRYIRLKVEIKNYISRK